MECNFLILTILNNYLQRNWLGDGVSCSNEQIAECNSVKSRTKNGRYPFFKKKKTYFVIILAAVGLNANSQYAPSIEEKISLLDSYFQNQISLYGEAQLLESECSEYNHYLKWKEDILLKTGGDGSEGDIYWNLKTAMDNQLPVLDGSGSWRELGPYRQPINSPQTENAGSKLGIGPLNFISFDPNYANTNLVFVGGWYSGLWFSNDAGVTWQNGGTDLVMPKVSASHCVSSSLNSNVWFLSTGNGDGLFNDGPFQSCRSDGIYRTTDGGEHWEQICFETDMAYSTSFYSHDIYFKPFQIKKLLLMPNSSDVLYATTNFGIYRCENASAPVTEIVWELVFGWDGNSAFQQVSTSVSNTMFSAYDILLRTDANDNPMLVATISKLANTANNTISLLPIGHSYSPEWIYSTSIVYSNATWELQMGDQGNWTELPNLPANIGQLQRASMAISDANEDAMYVWAMKYSAGFNQLHRYSWVTGIWETDLASMSNWTQADHAHAYVADGLCISPNNQNLLYIPSGEGPGMAKYDYSTLTETAITSTTDSYHDDVEDIQFSPDGEELWLATHGGIYVLDINNNTWEEKNNGLGIAEVDGLSQLINRDGRILVGLFHDGSVLMPNYDAEGYNNWNQVYHSDGRFTMTNQNNQNISYVSTQSTTLRRNNNSWQSTSVSSMIPGSSSEPRGVLNYFNNDIIYIERSEIHRHDNTGSSIASEWIQVSDFGSGANVSDVFASHTHTDFLFASVKMGNGLRQIALTNKANATAAISQSNWMVIPFPFDLGQTGAGVADIQSDPLNPNVFYVACNYYNPPWGSEVSYKLLKYEFVGFGQSNNLVTFDFSLYNSSPMNLFQVSDLTKNLPNVSILAMYLNRGTMDFFLATNFGVYFSNFNTLESSNTEPWFLYGDNLPHCDTKYIEPCFSANVLRAGVHGRGVWEIPFPCEKLPQDIIVQAASPMLLEGTYRFRQDIVVLPNATLTIIGHVYFAPNCGIIVKPGGHLIIDGGHLTNACPDQLWQGIVLEGNPELSQTPSHLPTKVFVK